MVGGGTPDLRRISGNPTWSYSLHTGMLVVAEDLQTALTEITAGRLLGRYYTRGEQQEFVKWLPPEISSEW